MFSRSPSASEGHRWPLAGARAPTRKFRMAKLISRDQVRELDRRAIEEFGVPGVVLMENAGHGAAQVLLRLGISGRVVVCCGKGNNGGDGFVIARHLDNHGIAVRVLFFSKPQNLT